MTPLKRYLDRFVDGFPREEHIAWDPVQFVHRYSDPRDREVAGFVAAAFAYGNVRSVLKTVDFVLGRMGRHPARFVRSYDPGGSGNVFSGFRHRWNNALDLAVLLWILGRMLERHGSLEAAFLAEGGSKQEDAVEVGLNGFSRTALGFGHEQFYTEEDLCARRGVRYFFPSPSGGSACKRLNLFLRWMVRPDDGVDCGVWTEMAPAHLIIPLDTHIARISRYIGLTERSSPGWAMAGEVTRSLRKLDPVDPLRYDFVLCHLGIAGDCPRKRDRLKCARCPLQPVCRL